MKYFIDTEFIEGTQKSIFNNKPTIDLISIGIVAEDGREYYAISKDFNLKEAWNRYDWKSKTINDGIPGAYKNYWIRDNVLKSIFVEFKKREGYEINNSKYKSYFDDNVLSEMICKIWELNSHDKNFNEFKKLINKYGKSNKQIAEEIKEFVYKGHIRPKKVDDRPGIISETIEIDINPYNQFYGYYSDYDWVVFCWLFGKMIDLPKHFPMYCIDLKQILDEKTKNVNPSVFNLNYKSEFKPSFLNKLEWVKNHPDYPKQVSEHNALADAKWNYELYKFLNKL